MVLRYAERIGTKDKDYISGDANTVYFGLQGDDQFYNANSDFTFMFGGIGNDVYNIGSPGTITVIDSGGTADKVSASGIGFNQTTTYAATIDNKHLVVGDTASRQMIYVYNYLDPQFRIESVILTSGTYTYDSIVSMLPKSPGFLGNFSWESFTSRLGLPKMTSNDVNEAAAYYLNREATLQNRAAATDYSHDPTNRIAISSGSSSTEIPMAAYSGPVTRLANQHIGTAANEAMRGSSLADFINAAGGDDAIDGRAGDDVLDGGLGSNFLTGGSGSDTFFVDGRGGGTTWSTVTDLEAGEWVTAWGWRQGTSKLTWAELTGAEGYKGATAHIDLDANGTIDMSVTITGVSSSLVLVTNSQVNGDAYLAFTLK